MTPEELAKDQKIIEHHGGISALAKLLNYKISRVGNWNARGIPAKEKLKFKRLLQIDPDKLKAKS